MPIFTYRARTKEGALIRGSSEAVDSGSAIRSLRNIGYSVVAIEAKSEWEDFYKAFWQKIRGVKYQEVVFFTRQLSTLLASGIPLDTALNSLSEQAKNPQFRKIITEVLADLRSGLSLSDAMMKHPHAFPQVYTSMIKVAEAAGILDKILERLSDLGLQDIEIRTRIRSALTYPIILVSLAVGVVTYLLASVVPRFVVIFATYGLKLPLATRMLLGVSLIARYFWFVAVVLLIIIVFLSRKYLKSQQGRYNVDSFLLKIPIVGNFYLKVILANFSRTLSALIKSGVPILEALSVTQRTIKNTAINRVIQDIRLAISEGKTMVEPFIASGIFPSMVIQMVSAGERTGKLDKMLSEIATFYDRETEYAIRNISSILEPALLLIMGFIVAFIALAILSPIFSLIKVFRH